MEEIKIKWWRSWKRGSAAAPSGAERAAPNSGWDRPGEAVLTPEEERLLDRLADATVRRRMTVPAILFLESVKPLSFIGSQALYFFEPMVRALFSVPEYERFATMLERRENIEVLLLKIEAKDADVRREEQERRSRERQEREARKRKGTP